MTLSKTKQLFILHMLFPNEILRAHLIQVFYQIFIKLGDDPVQDKTNVYSSHVIPE